MRWKGRRQSSNVEDRRGVSSKGIIGGGLGTVIIVAAFLLFGGDPSTILQNIDVNNQTSTNYTETAEDKELANFCWCCSCRNRRCVA